MDDLMKEAVRLLTRFGRCEICAGMSRYCAGCLRLWSKCSARPCENPSHRKCEECQDGFTREVRHFFVMLENSGQIKTLPDAYADYRNHT